MALYDSIALRVDNTLFAYVRIQNEYTGNISGSFRRIYKKDGHYYAKVDGRNHNMDNQVNRLISNESTRKEYVDFYNKYHKQIGGY